MIELDEATHTYRVDGRVVPSVTQILGVITNFDHVPLQVLEAARVFGTHVHMATDLFDKGELDEDALDVALLPYLNGWKRFLHETGFRVEASEERVHHKTLGYCGTLDKRGTWKKTSWLLDLKSGAVPRSAGAQTAAYREALPPGERPRRRLVLQLLRGAYKLHEQREPSDFSLFVSCLNVWKFVNGNKGEPKHVAAA